MRPVPALSVVALTALAMLLGGAPAGASDLGDVHVSNQSPVRASRIALSSTGWKPGTGVLIYLTGTDGVLTRATADATGAAHLAVAIPADAPQGRDVLSVTGTTPGGIPQQITTVLSVGPGPAPPAPRRPWTAVFLLAGLATLLLLANARSRRRTDEREPRVAAA